MSNKSHATGHTFSVESSLLTWFDGVVQYLIDSFDVLICRRMKNNDDGAQQADGTAELSQSS